MLAPQVLIAEDDEMLRRPIVEMLTEKGLRVMQAADGVEASQMLEDNAGISLLLSDVRMPRMKRAANEFFAENAATNDVFYQNALLAARNAHQTSSLQR
jgi:CheY-like chemotaxis protein